jgi:hypothetical protein
MRLGRLPVVMLATALSVMLWPQGGAHAQRKTAIAACKGTDLIARLAETDPLGHRRIVTRAAEVENSGAIFWLIEKDGLEPSYLLGTVHLTDERVRRLPLAAEMALERATRVAVETYFDSQEDVESVLSGMGASAISSARRRLSDHLSADEFERLGRMTKETRLRPEELDKLNPWVAEMLLRNSSCEGRRVEHGEPVLDAWIAGRAVGRGIGLERLETVAEQFETVAAIPYASQIAMLRYALTERATPTDDEIETMVGLYLRRQIPAIDALTRMLAPSGKVASAYLAAFWQDLIIRRNLRFVNNAKPFIEQGRVFIAVGAAHLPGERGVVQLLRNAGYRVTAADEGSSATGVAAALAEPVRRAKQHTGRSKLRLAAARKQGDAVGVKLDRRTAPR